jgi:ferredoxin
MASGHSQISANKRVCMGSGLCSYIAPDHFDVVDGVVQVLDPAVLLSHSEAVLEAVESCPTRALALLLDEGKPA